MFYLSLPTDLLTGLTCLTYVWIHDVIVVLRQIPFKVRAISAKINYQKSTHSIVTF